jgi:RimJ/RimL family protein N-acetyltransferase
VGEPQSGAGVEIRPVTMDDLEVLIDIYLDTAIHHAAIDPTWFHVPTRHDVAARLRKRIESRGEAGEYVAALVDGRMVGSATVFLEDPPNPGSMMRAIRTAEFGVSVVVGQRGRGIGRALIGATEAWAAEHGIERMILNVAEANVDAIRLYDALGYQTYDRAMRKAIGGS